MGGGGVTDFSGNALSVWGKKLDFNSEVLNRSSCRMVKKRGGKRRVSIVLAIILFQWKRYRIFRLLFYVNTE